MNRSFSIAIVLALVGIVQGTQPFRAHVHDSHSLEPQAPPPATTPAPDEKCKALKGVCGDKPACNVQLNKIVANKCGAGTNVCCVPLPVAGPPQGRTGTLIPNSAACIKKGGVCGMPAHCAKPGKQSKICGYSGWSCCVPPPTLPTPAVITPPGPIVPEPKFRKAFLMGQFEPKDEPGFVKCSYGGYLHKDTLAAYEKLRAAAKAEIGVVLTVKSTTRNWRAQKGLWEGSFGTPGTNEEKRLKQALKVLKYRSMPGTSQHHWGTTLDLYSLDNASFEREPGLTLDAWMEINLPKYGFCRPYNPTVNTKGGGGIRQTGYEEEQWHISYKPLLQPILKQYKDVQNPDHVTYDDIKASQFNGAELAQKIGMIEKYVSDINPDCLAPIK